MTSSIICCFTHCGAESLEENLGLKSGLLTAPALEMMNKYCYVYLAQVASLIESSTAVIDKRIGILGSTVDGVVINVQAALVADPSLSILEDSEFQRQRNKYQQQRLARAQEENYHKQLIAAEQFFEKIASYSFIDKCRYWVF